MNKDQADNHVILVRPNRIRVTVTGAQTGESVAGTLHEVITMLERPGVDQRAALLIDLSAGPGQNLAARAEARKFLTFLRSHRIAIFGAGYTLKTVVDIIIKGSGMTGQVGNFYKEEDALRWLQEK